MAADVFGLGHDFQVLGAIVATISVPVMDNLAFDQFPTKHFFGYHSMLVAPVSFDVAFSCAAMAQNVSPLIGRRS